MLADQGISEGHHQGHVTASPLSLHVSPLFAEDGLDMMTSPRLDLKTGLETHQLTELTPRAGADSPHPYL